MKTVFIYALKEPDTGEIRYVGKTKDPRRRLKNHLAETFLKNTRKTAWVKSLLSRGAKPVIEIIDEVPEEHWQQWEVAWIEFFKESGYRLVNGTLGGEAGPVRCGKENAMFGKPRPEHVRKKISISSIGKIISPEARKKIGLTSRGRKLSIAECERKTISQTGNKRRQGVSSRFVGVYWKKREGAWYSRITVSGFRLHLGRYPSEEDAAHSYDWVARLYFGESARVNFP